ncbi:unnamed protein product [Ilex paraguariensis]|uniref:Uncharacterized protein n=1 Tax=Ilex paraguariensis TaxID=185542 RepID=A0ABC8S6L4_9AQUA
MARILVLEGIAVGGGGGVNNGDRLFNHLSVGILLLCQVLIAMAIISVMLFGCADDQTGARKASGVGVEVAAGVGVAEITATTLTAANFSVMCPMTVVVMVLTEIITTTMCGCPCFSDFYSLV